MTSDDTLIATSNVVTSAEGLCVGYCYFGDIMEACEDHRALVNVPEYVFPASKLVFGYSTRQQIERAKPVRCDLKYIVNENGYHRMNPEQLRDMFAEKDRINGYDSWIHSFCERKYNSDFSREMSRSVAEYLKEFL